MFWNIEITKIHIGKTAKRLHRWLKSAMKIKPLSTHSSPTWLCNRCSEHYRYWDLVVVEKSTCSLLPLFPWRFRIGSILLLVRSLPYLNIKTKIKYFNVGEQALKIRWQIQDFPQVGRHPRRGGGCQRPMRLRFEKFVCQNERIGTLTGVLPLNPPMLLEKISKKLYKQLILTNFGYDTFFRFEEYSYHV